MSNRNPEQLVSVIMRLAGHQLRRLKALAKRTRIRQSEFLREAITDLLEKHESREREAQRVEKIRATHRRLAAERRS
jgi:predicted DNA-binding protein